MKWKEKMERLNRRVELAQAKLLPVWVELANKYPLDQIPMQMRDMPEYRELQAAMLDLQNYAIYTKRHNIDPEDEIAAATEMDGWTVVEFLGARHGLAENWWMPGSKLGCSLSYVISDTPIAGKDGMHDCYNWGFDYVEEAVRVRENLTALLNEGRDGKIYGQERELNEEQLKEKYGEVRLFLNVKLYIFNQ